jgi:hypothetical protein
MDFNLSEEQNMLKDSVSRFVADDYDFDTRRAHAALDEGFDRATWSTFAELGWLSIPFAEANGGFGGGAVDVMAVMEEIGRGLIVEPFVATVMLYGGLLQAGANAAQKDALIASVIDGSTLGAFAYLERQSRYDLNNVAVSATKTNDGYSISGDKVVVSNGMAADKIIVSARTSGEQQDEAGISLFLVDTSSDGVKRSSYRMMDGQVVANISFDNVTVSADALVGEEGNGLAVMQPVVANATVAICCEAYGIMQKLTDTTVDYCKTREQFGVKIGSFQALQHRMVEMFFACEQTKSLMYRAACSMDDPGAEDLDVAKNIMALKVMVGRAGKLVGAEAIQLHGGMGITDELNVGHYAKRLMMINTTFGDADTQQQKFSALTNS